MSVVKRARVILALLFTVGAVVPTFAQSRGKVLVVLSSAHELDLRDGKKYQTGYYLNEFVVPYRKLVEAGYTPVIADPQGNTPAMDPNSKSKMFFGGDDAALADALKYLQGIKQLEHPKTLAEVVSEGTSDYVGIFIPGGHAPMQDLPTDKNLAKILVSFHGSGRTTGIICHGPLVLLSTLADPAAFEKALIANDGSANGLAHDWPYAGYRLTVFSTAEEQQVEGPHVLGGYLRFYAANALAEAGAHVDTIANWHPNVIVDRELVTGQQPMSAEEFGSTFVAQLQSHSK